MSTKTGNNITEKGNEGAMNALQGIPNLDMAIIND